MTGILVNLAQLILMILIFVVGTFCSLKMTSQNPTWVRAIVLSPALAALYLIWAMLAGYYRAFFPDVILAVTILLMYGVIASKFTRTAWLDLKRR
jgi:hypothetical protein